MNLQDQLGQRLLKAERTRGGGWHGLCPRCGEASFWVLATGFSCDRQECGWKSTNFGNLQVVLDHRDGLQEGVEEFNLDRYEAPRFDRVLGPLLEEVNETKLAPVDAVPTHLPYWNKCCRDEGGGIGLARGWHLLVAGNTGMGKSLLALNLAAHAVRGGEKVGLISLEMSQVQAVTRYMAIFSQTAIHKLEHGSTYDEETAWQVQQQIEENHERNGGVLLTNRRPISKLVDIVGAMKWLHEHEGCRYFIADYLQLAWTGNAAHINERITEVSHSIRETATQLHVVSIGISQFNRGTSSSKDKPTIQGLMGGSALENDSEQAILLDHTSYMQKAAGYALIKLLLAKNRHGPGGEIPMAWDYPTLRCYQVEASRFDKKNGDAPPF